MEGYEGEKLLDRLYKDLHLSKRVVDASKSSSKVVKGIAFYLDEIDRIQTKAFERNRVSLLEYFYHKKYVSTENDIPDSYYKFKRGLEKSQGLKEQTKEEMAKKVIDDQKKSLNIWIEYLISKEAESFPNWAKYWTIQSITKLGNYNKESKTFSRRTKKTTIPFLELNKEVLGLTIKQMESFLKGEKVTEELLNNLLKNGSFGRLYTYNLDLILSQSNNKGEWIKYPQGDNYQSIVNDLYGFNTGWCSANLNDAKRQLEEGTLYVYYAKGQDNLKIPKVIIRMSSDKIGEVRGLLPGQDVEPPMVDISINKVKEINSSNSEEFIEKLQAIKILDIISKKTLNEETLSIEELEFLYEKNKKIKTCGWKYNELIEKIINKRNVQSDLEKVYNVSKDCCSKSDIEYDKMFYGDLTITKDVEKKILSRIVLGRLVLENENVDNIIFPSFVKKSLIFDKTTHLSGVDLPIVIKGNLFLDSVKVLSNVKMPKEVDGIISMFAIEECKNICMPISWKTKIRTYNSKIKDEITFLEDREYLEQYDKINSEKGDNNGKEKRR